MNPGDKVRFLRSSGEGYIRKLYPDQTAEVEIEDGFVIPVLQSEIVVIASEERQIFNKPETGPGRQDTPAKAITPSIQGIFLAITPFNDNIHKIELINLSGSELLYSVAEEHEDHTLTGLAHASLSSGQSHILGERALSELKNWLPLLVQILFFRRDRSVFLPPLVKSITFSPASLFKNKKKHPISGKEAYILEINRVGKMIPVETSSSLKPEDSTPEEKRVYETPQSIVDLHIDKITSGHQNMKADEILSFQLNLFEKSMENALAANLKEITFIHGSGSGTLKSHIHKSLGKNSQVEFFKDAQKEKFGYGATFVKFK